MRLRLGVGSGLCLALCEAVIVVEVLEEIEERPLLTLERHLGGVRVRLGLGLG